MRDLEKQIAEMARMDRVYQSSAEMVRRIEATASNARQIHDLAMSAAASGKRLQDQVDQALAWQKDRDRAEKVLRTASFAESALRSLQTPWSAKSALRSLQTPSTAESALRSLQTPWSAKSALRETMADIEKRRILIEVIQERGATAKAVETQVRVLRNVAAHQLDLSVEDDVDQLISKPLVVDVEKNLEAIRRTKVDQEDFHRAYEESAKAEAPTPPTVYGEHMMGFADVFFSSQDLERVFEPFVTDYRMEMEAAAGEPAKMLEIQKLYRKQFALAVLGTIWTAFCRLFNALRRS